MEAKINNRNSSFELLRIICQYMIVIYHIFCSWFYLDGPNPLPIFKVIWIPLHIGVIVYVLISGYFGVKFNIRKFVIIILQLFVYGFCFQLASHYIYGDNLKFKNLFFVSNTQFWFIRDYLFLFLLSPLINKAIRDITLEVRFVSLVIMIWISCWIGLMEFDFSLFDGKNLGHFIFLYILGDTIRKYSSFFHKIPLLLIVFSYIAINVVSICIGYYAITNSCKELIFNIFYDYNGPILILNALLFFVIFMRINFNSKAVNYLASSCLAVYLIHCNYFLLNHLIKDVSLFIQNLENNIALQILYVLIFGISLTLACVMLDKILTPVWSIASFVENKMERTRIGFYLSKYKLY